MYIGICSCPHVRVSCYPQKITARARNITSGVRITVLKVLVIAAFILVCRGKAANKGINVHSIIPCRKLSGYLGLHVFSSAILPISVLIGYTTKQLSSALRLTGHSTMSSLFPEIFDESPRGSNSTLCLLISKP